MEVRAVASSGYREAYLVMPTIVKTFWKCGVRPKAAIFCPFLFASITIWITSAIPLELMYSTLEKSISTGRLLVTPSYVPNTVSRELLEISPVKRRTVTGCPLAPITSSTLAFVSVCTLLTLLGQPDDQSHVASFARAPFNPLRLIHQRLDQEHTHAPRILFTMHLAVNVRFGRRLRNARSGVHHFHFERFIARGKNHPDA